jgi:hypothetical protein
MELSILRRMEKSSYITLTGYRRDDVHIVSTLFQPLEIKLETDGTQRDG